MYRPYIALSGSIPGDNMIAINDHYLNAIWKAGGIPVLLSPSTDEEYIGEVCQRFDGFLFCGGVDYDPKYYGEEKSSEIGEICPQRDEFEEKLFHAAHTTGKPIMGICRGIQGINVFLGGSLIQHMEGHVNKEENCATSHGIIIEKNSPLVDIIGEREILVNSFHHQAIKSLSSDLVVDAYSKDGYIEAVHAKGHRFLYGFQWHPESLYDKEESSKRIFKTFIDKCRNTSE